MTNEVAAAEHHVHFDKNTLRDEDYATDEQSVTYQQVDRNIVDVHLGFLQHKHRYLIELHLQSELFKCKGCDPIRLVADNNVAPNIHCKLADNISEISKFIDNELPENMPNDTKSERSRNGTHQKFYVIKVEYFAHKEKLLREELKLVNANNSEELLKLVVTARVLGKGKGTPMLRNGVHCLGSEPDDESDKEKPESSHK